MIIRRTLALLGAGSVPAVFSPRAALAQMSGQAQTGYSPLGNGLLGHLFTDAPYESITIIDIAIIGMLVFVAVRLWSSLSAQRKGQDYTKTPPRPPKDQEDKDVTPREASEAYRRAAQTWEHLSSRPKEGPRISDKEGPRISDTDQTQPTDQQAQALPRGFDARDFLKGAKMFYIRFKQSWDERDMDDLAQFTTPGMYRQLQAQAQAHPEPTQTTVLTLDARLAQAKQEADATVAEVVYTALLQEQTDQKSKEIKEVWRFSRQDDRKSSWRLESMERVQ